LNFREDVFLRALTERPETVKTMSRVFRPEWLKSAEFQPVLAEIYEFSKKHNVPPNGSTLRDIFQKNDKTLYEARFKNTLDKIEEAIAEVPDVLHTLEKARDVAISRSLMDMVNSPAFSEMNDEFDGAGQLQELEKWHRLFKTDHSDLDLSIREAMERLMDERGWNQQKTARIPCGLGFIDRWSAGGIRPKNLAILLAPTGHGKSIFLTVLAHNMAKQGDKVLYITNELSMEETTERFMTKITGVHLDKIIEDPNYGYHGLKRHWHLIENTIRLLAVKREIDSDEIEALVMKLTNAYGWRPDVIIIDFMERMKPTVSGVERNQSWNWLALDELDDLVVPLFVHHDAKLVVVYPISIRLDLQFGHSDLWIRQEAHLYQTFTTDLIHDLTSGTFQQPVVVLLSHEGCRCKSPSHIGIWHQLKSLGKEVAFV